MIPNTTQIPRKENISPTSVIERSSPSSLPPEILALLPMGFAEKDTPLLSPEQLEKALKNYEHEQIGQRLQAIFNRSAQIKVGF